MTALGETGCQARTTGSERDEFGLGRSDEVVNDFFPHSPKRIPDTASSLPGESISISPVPTIEIPDEEDLPDRLHTIELSPDVSIIASIAVKPSESPTEVRPRVVEKLRISLSSTSPNYSSSTSDPGSPTTEKRKKRKKRHCITCNVSFRHRAELLVHLRSHVSLPKISLAKIDETNNSYYREYLKRTQKAPTLSVRKDLNAIPASDGESNTKVIPNQNTSNPETPLAAMVALAEMTFDGHNTAESGSANPNFMSVAETDRVHFECPTLDGLDQFQGDEGDVDAAAELLKQMLENPQQTMSYESEATATNEFMSIDKLVHICTICHSNFADAVLLYEHKRITGHDFDSGPHMMMDSGSQPMHQPHPQRAQQQMQQPQMDGYLNQPPRPPMFTQQQQQQQQQQMMYGQPMYRTGGPMPSRPPPGSYGQPGVVPINQMQQQIRNFNMHQQGRFNAPLRPPFMPMAHPNQQNNRRTPPPLYRVPNPQTTGPNGQPLNMAPFMAMSPDMYNPGANGPSPGGPHQPRMNQPRMSALQRMQQHPMYQQPQAHPPVGPNGQPPQMMRPPGMPMMRGPRPPIARDMREQMFLQQQQQIIMKQRPGLTPPQRVSPNIAASSSSPPITGRPIVPPPKRNRIESPGNDFNMTSMQPPSNGPMMPIIKSVHSGGSKPTIPPHISDQITLSVKPKDPNGSSMQKNPKDVADILTTRGITVTPTAKNNGSARATEASRIGKSPSPTPKTSISASNEEAVNKLHLNTSVSIISRKRPSSNASSSSSATSTSVIQSATIDLSNDDDDKPPPPLLPLNNTPGRPCISCPTRDCAERFVTQEGLARHLQRAHRVNVCMSRCKLCSAKFTTPEGLATHHRRFHRRPMPNPHNSQAASEDMGLPVIDLLNEQTRKNLAALGIVSYIPLGNLGRTNGGIYGLPIVSMTNTTIASKLSSLGANNMLTLGPLRHISKLVPVQQRSSSASFPVPRPSMAALRPGLQRKPTQS